MLIWMKSAYASKLATHFLIQTSAWLNCNINITNFRAFFLTKLLNTGKN